MSIIDLVKNTTFALQRGGYRYSAYLKKNGVTDEVSQSVAKKYDNVCVPFEVGKELENISDFKKTTMFVHKTSLSDITDGEKVDVFENGVTVPSNGTINIRSISNMCSNFWTLMDKIASTGKDECSVLIKIPNDCLKGTKPMYYSDGETVRLLPEFVFGIASIDKAGRINIISNPKYTDTHDYPEDGLISEGQEVSKLIK